MANTLLDFVMSLVRDPEAAARYAADPAQVIADAHLTDVTTTDVDNLIPVVSESLSMGATGGTDAFGAEPADNVWASGAATAAFDAFGDHIPFGAGDAGDAEQVIHVPEDLEPAGSDVLTALGLDESAPPPASVEVIPPIADPLPAEDPVFGTDWGQPILSDHSDTGDLGDDGSGLDIFD